MTHALLSRRLIACLKCLFAQLAEAWRLVHLEKSYLEEIEDKYNLFL